MRSNFAVNSHYYFFHQTSKKIQKDSDPNGKLTIHVYPIKFRIIFIQPLPTPPHAARSAAHQPKIRCESIMQAVHSPKPNGRLKVSRGIWAPGEPVGRTGLPKYWCLFWDDMNNSKTNPPSKMYGDHWCEVLVWCWDLQPSGWKWLVSSSKWGFTNLFT